MERLTPSIWLCQYVSLCPSNVPLEQRCTVSNYPLRISAESKNSHFLLANALYTNDY